MISRIKSRVKRIISIYRAIVALAPLIADADYNLDSLDQRMRNVEKWIQDAGFWMSMTETRINEHDLMKNLLIPDISIVNSDSTIEIKDHFDYYNFEKVFRGSEQLIKQRQRLFLPLFQRKSNIVDLGSGRGEFLEILEENGLKGVGVDFDLQMVTRCQEKGLNVRYSDIIEYVKACPDESIDGFFSSQVIEHLSIEKLDLLIRTAYRKLKKEGIFVVETVNPYNLLSFRLFYLDPSHQKPLFPELISFICYSSGFTNVKIKYIPMDLENGIDSMSDALNKWKCGEYAIIAEKIT
jgi:SAM-dependent methyltransferase